jgi:hypothetical protein
MRAVAVEEPEAPRLVAKDDEVLAEEPLGDRQLLQLG